MAVTHKELVEIAAQWLWKSGNSVVITELCISGEEPDAIGWRGWHSTLIECKASLSDFKADAKKAFRKYAEIGIGQKRYYCVPKGLIKKEDLPHGWGLLEYTGKGLRRVVKSSSFRKCNSRHELEIVLSALRRVGQVCPKGVSVRCYVTETKNKTTVGVSRIRN
jgi:hypothetical protein